MKAPGRNPEELSSDAREDPRGAYLERRLLLRSLGVKLTLLAPHSVFSSGRIDSGTQLLLENLPPGSPRTFLDLGCGYGALGLPVAARFPESRGFLVDRDLLAVEFARWNASLSRIENVSIAPSLGFRDLPREPGRFDWILLNVPARVGDRVLEHFLLESLARLEPGGELRLVIIAPLATRAVHIAERRGRSVARIAATERHAILALPAGAEGRKVHAEGTEAGAPSEATDRTEQAGGMRPVRATEPMAAGWTGARGPGGEWDEAGLDVYVRDRIHASFPDPLGIHARTGIPDTLALPCTLEIERPTDLADEPGRLETAIPLLAEHLPPEAPARILVFRCGYGLLPLLMLRRYPRSEVLAFDRDLLATAFTRRNCAASGESASRLRVEEAVGLGEAASSGLFDLVLGELSSPMGERANAAELSQARSALAPGGRGLVLASKKQWKEWLRPRAEILGLSLRETRGTAAVIEIGA